MGKVYFLNEKSRQFHKDNNIEIERPDYLKLVYSRPDKLKSKKKKTMGQRIYERLLNENGTGDDAG